jgi:radical SAM-linked protein
MNSVRIWYKKEGLAIYTSHLDMNRCFTRAVRRAGIPLWYTEGFNPHPYLNFLLPLPLGQTGIREPLDIRTERDMAPEEIKSRLNSVLPEGIEIVDVTQAVNKVNSITCAEYIIEYSFSSADEAEGFAAGINAAVASGELNAEKRSKKGIKTVNLCDFVISFEAAGENDAVTVRTVLATGSEKNLNAGLLADTLCGVTGAQPLNTAIKRTKIYMNNMKNFE